jgi:hypothetical protein
MSSVASFPLAETPATIIAWMELTLIYPYFQEPTQLYSSSAYSRIFKKALVSLAFSFSPSGSSLR